MAGRWSSPLSGWRWRVALVAVSLAAAPVAAAMAAGATGAGAPVAASGPTGLALVVVDGDAAHTVVDRLAAGERVELAYVHSIYGAPARERFRVEGIGLTLVSVTSPNDAVLDYYAVAGGRTVGADGWRTLTLDEPVQITALPLIATPVGQRTVVVRGRCYPLWTAAPGSHVTLTVRRNEAHGKLPSGPCPFEMGDG